MTRAKPEPMQCSIIRRALFVCTLGCLSTNQWAQAQEPAPPTLVRTILTELSERYKEQPAMDVQVTSKYEWPDEPREGIYTEHGSSVNRLKTDGTRFAVDQSLFKKSPNGTTELQTTSHIVWDGERYLSWKDEVSNAGAFTGRDAVLASSTLSDPEMGLWLDGRCCSNTTIVDELLKSGQELNGTIVTDDTFGRSMLIEADLQIAACQVWISTARPYLLHKYSVERKQGQLNAINPRNKVIQSKDVVTITKFDQVGPHLVPIRGTIERDVLNSNVAFVTRIVVERSNVNWVSESELSEAFQPTMPVLTKVRNLEDLTKEGIWDGQSVQFTTDATHKPL